MYFNDVFSVDIGKFSKKNKPSIKKKCTKKTSANNLKSNFPRMFVQ